MLKTALLQLRTRGLKNIENEVSIDFYHRKTLLDFDLAEDRVRVLYGPNGSGKSAVVASVWLAKSIVASSNFLSRCGSAFFDKLLNKRQKTFSLSFLIASWDADEKRPLSFRYSISLAFEGYDLQIREESLSHVPGARLDERKSETVFLAKDGKLLEFHTSLGDEFFRAFSDEAMNVCRKNSVLNMFLGYLNKSGYSESFSRGCSADKNNFGIHAIISFFAKLAVYLDSSDLHEEEMNPPKELIDYISSVSKEELAAPILDPMKRGNQYSVWIKESDLPRYRAYVGRLSSFIKQFKPELSGISIDERPDGDQYRCSLVFHYGSGDVDFEFESTGIKKLTNVFGALESSANGGCSFVDELDANISGVYLKKIIEFFNQYTKGQLFFTAHSLDPMYALYQKPKSIYFIGNDNLISVWTKSGNSRPYTLYPDGMVPGIYFNIDAFDFLSCFDMEE